MKECIEIIKKLFLENSDYKDIFHDIVVNLCLKSNSNFAAIFIKDNSGKLILYSFYTKEKRNKISQQIEFNNLKEMENFFSKFQENQIINIDSEPKSYLIYEKYKNKNDELILDTVRMIKIIINEMKRKENEKRLQELKTLLDKSRDIFYIVNKNGIIEYINERVRDYGYTPNEIIGRTPFEFANPQYLNYLTKAFKKAFRIKKTAQKLEYQLLKKDGTPFDVEQRSEIIFDEKGNPIKIVGTVRDISEEKKMLKKIHESESLLSQIFENARDIIYVKDLNENYLRVNKSFIKFFGFKKYEDALSKRDDELFDEETAKSIWKEDEEVKNGKVLSIVRERNTKKGKIIIHSIRVPIKDNNGQVKYILGIVRDITKLTKLQQRLAASKLTKDMSQKLSVLAHDINNILGVITGYASMVELGIKKHKELLREIKVINKSAKKISKMISSFRKKVTKTNIS
ncbi:MAG: PAS domain S-box protein [Elusimicrobiales bacterium]|nr:PAS domain S-box protein [Elusimicrobiales bacterium]